MLTIIPYEVKPSQINKEHKNLYKEICQQKTSKKWHCTLSYVSLEPLQKERVQAKTINMNQKTKVKYSRKTKTEEKYKDEQGDVALVPSIIFQ